LPYYIKSLLFISTVIIVLQESLLLFYNQLARVIDWWVLKLTCAMGTMVCRETSRQLRGSRGTDNSE
jgi:hypothetical protein